MTAELVAEELATTNTALLPSVPARAMVVGVVAPLTNINKL